MHPDPRVGTGERQRRNGRTNFGPACSCDGVVLRCTPSQMRSVTSFKALPHSSTSSDETQCRCRQDQVSHWKPMQVVLWRQAARPAAGSSADKSMQRCAGGWTMACTCNVNRSVLCAAVSTLDHLKHVKSGSLGCLPAPRPAGVWSNRLCGPECTT